MNIRNSISIAFIAVGFILFGISLYNNLTVVAISLALAGIYCGCFVYNGVGNSIEDPNFRIFAALILLLGLVGTFSGNKAFDQTLQKSYIDVAKDALDLHTFCPNEPEISKIQQSLLHACTLQGNSDQTRAIVEIGKGLNYSPPLTLADGVSANVTEKPKNSCALAFKTAHEKCSSGFISVRAERKELLLKEAQ